LISALSENAEFGNVPAINALLKLLARSDELKIAGTAKEGAAPCGAGPKESLLSTGGSGEDRH
jgi:hypothetical protein